MLRAEMKAHGFGVAVLAGPAASRRRSQGGETSVGSVPACVVSRQIQLL